MLFKPKNTLLILMTYAISETKTILVFCYQYYNFLHYFLVQTIFQFLYILFTVFILTF